MPGLKGVSMTIARGEFVALTGASGSGTSTPMNILGCLDCPTAGRYWLDGGDGSRLTPEGRAVVRGRKIGFVFQNFSLLSRTRALDKVMMPFTYAVSRPSAAESRKRAVESRRLVWLADRMDHHPSPLSADSSSASPAPARSSMTRRCCSPTSRPVISTQRRGSKSWTCSAS